MQAGKAPVKNEIDIRYYNIPSTTTPGKPSGNMFVYVVFDDDFGYSDNQCEGTENTVDMVVTSNLPPDLTKVRCRSHPTFTIYCTGSFSYQVWYPIQIS